MFEAYSVGVTLRLNNLITEQLTLLGQEFTRLDGLVATLNASLSKLGSNAAGLRAIAKSGIATSEGMDKATASAARLERQLAALHATGSSIPMVPMIAPPGGAGRGAGGGGAGGGYGGRGHGYGPHGGNIHMGPGGIGMGTVGLGMGADAFVPLAITGAAIWGGHSLYEAAKDLDTEKRRFKLYGMNEAVNAAAFEFVKRMKVYGTTEAENMKAFRESQGVFRESGLNDTEALAGAKLAAPVLAKIEFATRALDPEKRSSIMASSLAMLRYVEMSGGLKDAQTFNKLADFGFKMVTTSGGSVDWEQLRQFKAIGGVATQRLTPEAMAMMEPIISELKGGGAGTGMRTAFNRLSGIVKVPNQVAHTLIDQGIWDKAKVEFNSNGGIKRFNGDPFHNFTKEFLTNFPAFIEKTILPMYDRMKLGEEERLRMDAMIFGGTGGRLAAMVRQQLPKMHQSAQAMKLAMGIDKASDNAKQGLSGQEEEFTSAWKDFKQKFGTVFLPQFSAMLRTAADVLRLIGSFIDNFPTAIGNLGKAVNNTLNPIGGTIGGAIDFGKSVMGFFQRNNIQPPKSSGPVAGSSAWQNQQSAQALADWRAANKGSDSFVPKGPASAGAGAAGGAAAAPTMVQTHTTIQLDKRTIAQAVTEHQAREASRVFSSNSGMDPTYFPQPVGMR